MEIEGKVAFITGAAQGIGAALARRFVSEGAAVAAVDLQAGLLEALEREGGGKVLPVAADMCRADEIERAFDVASRHFGRLDILVNCAVFRTMGALNGVDEAAVDLALAVGVKGYILCAKRAAREMRGRRGGAIVNMSSFYSLTPAKGRVVYAAVKGAVNSLTRALAVELAVDDIRVNAVAAGPIMTERRRAEAEADPGYEKAEQYRSMPMGRFGRPEEVVEAILYLVTPRSSYMTGQVLVVDGGLTIS